MTFNIFRHSLFVLGVYFVFSLANSASLVAQNTTIATPSNLVLTAQTDNWSTGTYHQEASDFIQANNQKYQKTHMFPIFCL